MTQELSTAYMISYSIVAIIMVVLLSILLLRNIYVDDIEPFDDDEEGGLVIYCEGPDIPLPTGISLHKTDWEPEYNKPKQYA